MENVARTFKDYSLYLAVFFLSFGFTACSDDDDGDIIDNDTGSVSVEDQAVMNNVIIVNSVQADDDGWLVVRRDDSEGEMIAEPYYIDDDLGTQTDVEIDLYADANLQDGETIVVILHEDDDDDVWNEDGDFPFTDDLGEDVMDSFTVTVEDGGDSEIFSIEQAQMISQNRIRIDEVTVDEPGWLVARNAGSETESDIVSEAVPLEAGVNENLTLTLNQNATLSGTEEGDDIVLMIHTDDGDGEYSYDGENGDMPLSNEEGEPITYNVNVTGPSLSAENDQTVTEDNEVTFSSVNTYGNGWVTLYAENEDGEIDYDSPIGRQYVEAGTYEDFTVPFDEGYTYTAGQTVYPRLHMDDPADEEFSYTTDGTEDMPEVYGYDETTGEGRYVTNNTTETGGFTVQ